MRMGQSLPIMSITFGFSIFNQLQIASNASNVICSPLSLWMALAMVASGSKPNA